METISAEPICPGSPDDLLTEKHEINCERASAYLADIRGMIKHENDLINQRLTWMFTLQGLLFGAVGFLWTVGVPPIIILGLVGLISCISIGYTLARGNAAIRRLVDEAEAHKRSVNSRIALAPAIGVQGKAIEWLLPARLLPWVIGAAWIAMLLYRTKDVWLR